MQGGRHAIEDGIGLEKLGGLGSRGRRGGLGAGACRDEEEDASGGWRYKPQTARHAMSLLI
jgi:hypothetical protein